MPLLPSRFRSVLCRVFIVEVTVGHEPDGFMAATSTPMTNLVLFLLFHFFLLHSVALKPFRVSFSYWVHFFLFVGECIFLHHRPPRVFNVLLHVPRATYQPRPFATVRETICSKNPYCNIHMAVLRYWNAIRPFRMHRLWCFKLNNRNQKMGGRGGGVVIEEKKWRRRASLLRFLPYFNICKY